MNCKIYQNTHCINECNTGEKFSEYCCEECLIHMAIEHDTLSEDEKMNVEGE